MKQNQQLVLASLLITALIGGCTLPTPAPAVPQTTVVPAEENTIMPLESEATPVEDSTETLPATSSLEGRWEGSLSIAGTQLNIVTTFSGDGEQFTGTIDIPQQGATGLPLHDVSFAAPAVHFEMLAGPQLAIFEGELQADGSIAGTFSQAGFEGTFQLQPAVAAVAAAEPAAEPLPYGQEEVTFGHDDVTLAGTLTLPEGTGPHPALILLTGSGPQNRDEEIYLAPGYKPFADIADYLTRRGIAVLRYDDRGIGGSSGEVATATTADFAADAAAALTYLLERNEIDAEQIGLLGHSEGGLIATMLGAENPAVAFVILMAGPGESGYDVVLDQALALAADSGASDEELETTRALQIQVLDAVRNDEGWETLEEMLLAQTRDQLAQLPEAQRAQLGNLDTYAAQTIAAQISQLQSPWYRFFISYDPGVDLAQIKVPVLALYGGLDLQVPAEANAAALIAALADAGNEDVTVETIANANHLFQAAESGGVDEYGTLDPVLVPGFLETIGDWLLAHVEVADE